MSLTDNGCVYTGRLHGYEAAFEANLRALGVHTINSTPSPADLRQDRTVLADAEEVAARPPRPGHPDELNTLLETIPRLLQPPPPAPSAARGHTRRGVHRDREGPPADRPLPAPVFVTRHTVGEQSGKLHVPPYESTSVCAGPAHHCDVIRHGDHIAIFSGTTLVRELTADPTRSYQPSAPNTRTYRTREPKPTS